MLVVVDVEGVGVAVQLPLAAGEDEGVLLLLLHQWWLLLLLPHQWWVLQ